MDESVTGKRRQRRQIKNFNSVHAELKIGDVI